MNRKKVFLNVLSGLVCILPATGLHAQNAAPAAEKDYLMCKNNIKLNVVEAAHGVFSFSYERVLSDKFSAELTAGTTYRDYLFETFKDHGIPSDADVKLGYDIEAGFRYYPEGKGGLSGVYVNPEVSFRTYNISEHFVELGETRTGNDSYKMIDGRIKLGYQTAYEMFKGFAFDYYLGFGIRSVTMNSTSHSVEGDSNQGYYYVSNTDKNKVFIPQILAGIKIGMPF